MRASFQITYFNDTEKTTVWNVPGNYSGCYILVEKDRQHTSTRTIVGGAGNSKMSCCILLMRLLLAIIVINFLLFLFLCKDIPQTASPKIPPTPPGRNRKTPERVLILGGIVYRACNKVVPKPPQNNYVNFSYNLSEPIKP